MLKQSAYEILGLEGDFNFKDIKKAYRLAIMANPPEQHPQEFTLISDAYDRLTNEDYFLKEQENHISYLKIENSIDDKVIDNKKYLTKIFETPFS